METELMSRYLKRTVISAALLGLCFAGKTSACELDGMSHGYGPMAALFAGAHRYQSLNGLDDEPPPEPAAAAESISNADADAEAKALASSAIVSAAQGAGSSNPEIEPTANTASPTARRSFASWVRAAPKPTESSDAPAAWTRAQTPSETPTPSGD